jgi:hypothetical protein
MKGKIGDTRFSARCGEGLLDVDIACAGIRIREDVFRIAGLIPQV